METKVIKVEIPEGIDLKHTFQAVTNALYLPENVTQKEYNLIESILDQLANNTKKRIAIIWGEDDVRGVAEDQGVDLTDDQVHHLLARLEKDHDAEIGITWDVIASYVDLYALQSSKK